VVPQPDREEEDAVDASLHQHADKRTTTLSCFDRLIVKGDLRISYPEALENVLSNRSVLLKDFKTFGP
jgi:hypothetical protein